MRAEQVCESVSQKQQTGGPTIVSVSSLVNFDKIPFLDQLEGNFTTENNLEGSVDPLENIFHS